MKTNLRKEVDKGVADKLLLNEATNWQIIKRLHKSTPVVTVEIFAVGLAMGWFIGATL